MNKPAATTPRAVAQHMLHDADVMWSIGTRAVCAFPGIRRDPAPELAVKDNGGAIVTRTGALQFAFPGDTVAIAYEQVGPRPHSWTQSISFCVREPAAVLSGRTALMELGPDVGAVRPDDRSGVLFDLGLGVPHMEFCVRTEDPALKRILRRGQGRNVFVDASDALSAISAAEPHRVCRSAAARIEHFQPDALRQYDDTANPLHSHLLHHRSAVQRCKTDDAPIPPGLTPVLTAHPRSPVAERGGLRPPLDAGFDVRRYEAFQRLLQLFAPAGYMEEKLLINWAVCSGLEPRRFPRSEDEWTRRAARIALRQMVHACPDAPNLQAWLRAFDNDQ
ncbi:MAG: hypothetical protein IPM60_06770 [Rhodospirillales bacterium]|nr:hypothetical protein [Rhodospirillales bacterium]